MGKFIKIPLIEQIDGQSFKAGSMKIRINIIDLEGERIQILEIIDD